MTVESHLAEVATYCGVFFADEAATRQFWKITCPCRVEQTYAVNELPVIDTPMPCGNPKHWAVKIGAARTGGEG